MTDKELIDRGWSVPIYRAVQLAGGPAKVADAMGLHYNTARNWYANRSIKAKYVTGLCALGGYRVKPEEILADMAAERRAA